MRDDIFAAAKDSTPLTADEKRDLKPAHVATRAELNALEQANIGRAELWAFARQRPVLTEPFLRSLHKRMLGDVWKWAGIYRRSERNIGIDHWHIPTELASLLQDVPYWVEHQTYPPDEIAVRLHHRLVFIHPFPNGNGRHARLAADILLRQLGRPRFTWGRLSFDHAAANRQRYIDCLKQADAHDSAPLLGFART